MIYDGCRRLDRTGRILNTDVRPFQRATRWRQRLEICIYVSLNSGGWRTPAQPLGHCEAAFRFELIMMVVAEAPVVKVASAPVLIIETPVVNSDRNEEETEGCHPFDGTMFTLLIF